MTRQGPEKSPRPDTIYYNHYYFYYYCHGKCDDSTALVMYIDTIYLHILYIMYMASW